MSDENNILTASRMEKLLKCPRAHFWSYEIGLRKEVTTAPALRFGSAWAKAMEARWHKESYEDALAFSIPEGVDLDEYQAATLSALLAAYYDIYGKTERAAKIHPEVQFESFIEVAGVTFKVSGKIDGLGSAKDRTSMLVESKTTGDSISPDSDYWLRLRFNIQVLNYVSESRKIGWDVRKAFYDVTRKPAIKPKQVTVVRDGKKVVLDSKGKRVKLKNGEWRESGDTKLGYVVQTKIETPEQFCDRLYKDAKSRPDFYFKRHEIPIVEQEVEDFEREREELAALIVHYRSREDYSRHGLIKQEIPSGVALRDPQAWPRRVSTDTCDFCEFKNFCLQNLSVNLNEPPAGFQVMPFNPELEKYAETEITNETTDTAAA